MAELWRRFLDLAYPPLCAICRRKKQHWVTIGDFDFAVCGDPKCESAIYRAQP